MRNKRDELLRNLTGWEVFKSRIKSLSNDEKGRAFEHLVQLYLQHAPLYKSLLRSVWLREQVPNALSAKLKLPATDQGIDLIAETFDGEYWAIQCKYREAESNSIPWKEISTFIGLACIKNFNFCLVCTSTEHVTKIVHDISKVGFCAIDVWRHLDSDFFTLVDRALANKPAKLVAREPRPHQKRAIEKGRSYFEDDQHTRGKFISPCGSGKSLTGFWLTEALNSRSTLVAVPSLALLRQTLNVWLRELSALGQRADWLCVCSDESAGDVQNDDLVVYAHDFGIPCTTDAAKVGDWLRAGSSDRQVIFTTYQSATVVSDAARRVGLIFDVGILDEAHKTVGRKDRAFSHLLFDKNIPIRRRLFMTATERRYQGSSDEIVSMGDEAIYGDTFELLTFRDAIQQKPAILSDYEVLIVGVTDNDVHELIEKRAYVRTTNGDLGDVDATTLAGMLALRKAIKMTKLGIKHVVSFHRSIAASERFMALNERATHLFPEEPTIHTSHVSGKMTTATRDSILKDFAVNEPSLVTNARCLTEGVDIPEIDCVFFADARKSTIDIVQAAGRAMRCSPNKTKGYIVVPVFVADDISEDEIIESSAFEPVFTVLRALASNDDRIIEYFRAVSSGHKPTSQLIRFDVQEILPQDIEMSDFVQGLELRCWNKLATLSWQPYEQARDYVRGLDLSGVRAWRTYCASGDKPPDIPAYPDEYYAGKGWTTWGDWLGTGTIAPYLIQYRPFMEARGFARSLSLKSGAEWRKYCASEQKPDDIPATPGKTYEKDGWIGMPDWLGTERRYKTFREFSDARQFIQSLGLKNISAWKKYCKLPEFPPDIPKAPWDSYKKCGWISIGDWLGSGAVSPWKKKHRPFHEARAFVQSSNVKSRSAWQKFIKDGKKPDGVPVNPDRVYKNAGWASWGDWFGTDAVAPQKRQWLSFEEARAYVHTLGLNGQREWGEYSSSGKRPPNIPADPWSVYKNSGWKGYGDWLGSGRVSNRDKVFWEFEKARAHVRKQKLKGQAEWAEYCKSGKMPRTIPTNPSKTYKDKGWTNYGDWLGTGRIANRNKQFWSFSKARSYARNLGLKDRKAWRDFCATGKKPPKVPATPDSTYKNDGWVNYGDWLGSGTVSTHNRVFLSFAKARAFVHKRKFRDVYEWRAYCTSGKKPTDIPSSPETRYKNEGWAGYKDWLGHD